MAEVELKAVISADTTDFVAETKKARNSLGQFVKAGSAANKKLEKSFGGNILKGLKKNLGEAGKIAKKAGNAIAVGFRTGLKVLKSVALGAGVVVTALGGIGIAAVNSFAKFQSSFSQVRTLIDESEATVAGLEQGVRDLSVAFGVDAVAATNAAYQAISAGQKPAEVLDFLKVSFEGAAAGAADVVSVVDLFTSALNTFQAQGVTAADASDVLFTTVKQGKTTITELAGSFGQVAPIAAAAGVKFSELGAALATTTAQGLSTAEAATAIKSSIAGIVNPAGAAKGALLSIGVSAKSLREEGLVETFRKIGEATGGSVDQIVKFLPNIRAVNAAAILAGGGLEKFAKNAEESANATGAASDAFGKVEKDLTLQFNRIRQTLTDTFREIGKSLTPLVASLGAAFSTFATKTRAETIALARVLSDRFGQASKSIDEFGEEIEDSGGVVTLGLSAVKKALELVAEGFDLIAEPVAGIVSGFEFLADLLNVVVVGSLAASSLAFGELLRAVTFVPIALLEASAALASFAGLDIADDLEGAAQGLKDLQSEADSFTESLVEQTGAAVETVSNLDNLTKTFGETKNAVKGVGDSFRKAAEDAGVLTEEVEKTEKAIADEKALADQKKKLDALGPAAKDAAAGLTDLATAAGGVAAPIGSAKGAVAGLSSALSTIAAGSAAAARGLADLGPKAVDIAKKIAAIGTSQTADQALKTRQQAITALITAANSERSAALAKSGAEAKKQIDAAAKQLAEAKQLRELAGRLETEKVREQIRTGELGETEGLTKLFEVADAFEKVSEREIAAQENLDAVLRRVSDSVTDQRGVITDAFNATVEEVKKLGGSLDEFRDQQVANAEKAGQAEIAALERAASESQAKIREGIRTGEIGEVEGLTKLFESQDEAAEKVAQTRARIVSHVDQISDRFDRLGEEIAEADIAAAFDAAFPSESSQLNALADALTGEFAEAVSAAREQAELFGVSQEELDARLDEIVVSAAAAAVAMKENGDATQAAGKKAKSAGKDFKAASEDGLVAGSQFEEALKGLGFSAEQTEEILVRVGRGTFAELGEKAIPLSTQLVKLSQEGFGGVAEAADRLGEKLDTQGKEKIAELGSELATGQITVEQFAEGLKALGEEAGIAGRDLKALAQAALEAGDAAEAAGAKAGAARNSFSRTGVGQRPGGETQAQVNQRFGGFGFGIQSRRQPTVQGTFSNLSPSQRNAVREQARQAGVTNDEEFTRFVVQNSPGLDAGGLSFDLGGPVRVDQLAKLQQGERVLTRGENSALGQLVQSFTGRVANNSTVNVSPTFNIEGGNAESFRQTARDLLPEMTRAVKLGVTGKGLL